MSWTTSAIAPHATMSTGLTLCAIALASGSTKPISAPDSEIDAAMFPSRISLSLAIGRHANVDRHEHCHKDERQREVEQEIR